MKIFILFFVLSSLLISQEQIKWKNEGSSSEIRVRYRLQNENKILFQSIVNSKTMLQCYDYEKNELLSNFDANDAISINLSYDNSILIINKDKQNTVYRYDYNGNIIKEYQVTLPLYHAIEYADNKVFTLVYENGENKLVQYDLIKNEVITELTSYNIKELSNNYYIDNKLFLPCLLEDNSKITYTFDINEGKFLTPLSGISTIVRSYEIFENTIVTFHQQRVNIPLTQFITYLDRNTLDTIKTYSISTDEDYIEVLNEHEPIAIRIDSNFNIQEYNLETNEVVKELKKDFLHSECMKLNNGFYLGYSKWKLSYFNIYNKDFNDLNGKRFPIPSNTHHLAAQSVKIVGDKIISGASDGLVIEWDLDGNYIKSPVNVTNRVLSLDYSKKHNLVGVAYGYPKGRIEVYDAFSWELKFEKDYNNNIFSFRFNDEIDKFLIMGFKNDIDIFDSENFNLINTIQTEKDTISFDLECSAILLDNSKLAYTYRNGLVIYNYLENKEIANKQLYESLRKTPVIYLEKSKTNNEILVSGYDLTVYLVDFDLNIKNIIETNLIERNSLVDYSDNKTKSSYINDSLMYLLDQQNLVVFNLNQDSIIFNYNELNPYGNYPGFFKYNDFDYNSQIVTTVTVSGGVYGIMPYNIVTSVKKNITSDLVYPNPVKSEFKLNLDYFDEVKIFDLNGFIVKDIKHNSDKINISDIPSGVYYLQVKQNNEIIYTKLVKE